MLKLRKKPTSNERYFGKHNRFTQSCDYDYYMIRYRITNTRIFTANLWAANYLQRLTRIEGN